MLVQGRGNLTGDSMLLRFDLPFIWVNSLHWQSDWQTSKENPQELVKLCIIIDFFNTILGAFITTMAKFDMEIFLRLHNFLIVKI